MSHHFGRYPDVDPPARTPIPLALRGIIWVALYLVFLVLFGAFSFVLVHAVDYLLMTVIGG